MRRRGATFAVEPNLMVHSVALEGKSRADVYRAKKGGFEDVESRSAAQSRAVCRVACRQLVSRWIFEGQ